MKLRRVRTALAFPRHASARSSLYRILESVKTERHRFGATVSRTELIGLVPQSALIASAEHYLQVMDFSEHDTVENRLDAILHPQD